MKTSLPAVGERVPQLLLLEALTTPSGGFGWRCRLAVSALAAFMVIGLALTPSVAHAAVEPCGGLNQRACCIGCGEHGPNGACDSGLIEQFGCSGNCLCGGPDNCTFWGFSSSGTCVDAKCGEAGERGCCDSGTLSNGRSCINGLIEDFTATCSDILGGANCHCENDEIFFSSGICAAPKKIGEACDLLTLCESGLVCFPKSPTEAVCVPAPVGSFDLADDAT
jgi:hypothetical protein